MLRDIKTKEIWRGEPIDGVRHPRSIENLWSDSELKSINLERFTPPEPKPAARPPRRTGTFLEFMDRFSEADQIALLTASKQSPKIDLLIRKAGIANRIDLDSPVLAGALSALVEAEVIDQAKADAALKDFD